MLTLAGPTLFLHIPQLLFAGGGDRDHTVSLYFTASDAGAGASRQDGGLVALYDALRPSLLAYLIGMGLLKEEAEDVIQDAFLRLMGRSDLPFEEQQVRPWIFRVAHNLAVDHFRSGHYRTTTSSEEVLSLQHGPRDKGLNPEESLLKNEQWRIAQQAISRLTPQQKYAVLLRSEGLVYREIAEVLGVGTKRAAELVQRALVRLAGGQ